MRKLVVFAMMLTLFQVVSITTGLGTKKVAAASNAGEFTAQKIPVLLNATRLTLHGTPHGTGQCEIVPPKLTLAPNEAAKQADELSVNTITCTSVWQIGTPIDLTTPTGPNYSSATQQAGSVKPKSGDGVASPSTTASLNTSSGYTYAWIEDLVGLTTTSDQSNIAWSWDGSCVRSASGSATWWWLTETHWNPPYNNGVWINTYCSWSKVWSQTDFTNARFCAPIIVYAHYRGVSVRGWASGYMDGWADSMWTDHSCLPLFTHIKTVRSA